MNLPVSTCGICTRDDLGFVAVGGSFVGFGVCLFVGPGIGLFVSFGVPRFVSLATLPVLTALVGFTFPVMFATGF